MPPFLLFANVSGFYGYLLPFDLALSTSTLVELVAWIAVLHAGPLGEDSLDRARAEV
ncbi:MAG: hypothetical protein JNN27_00160 [Planctomycetes bacterium]|nr:hypothetical protein [Planctomycetota bacterium]